MALGTARQLVALALATVLAPVLVGCGSGGPSASPSSPSSSPSSRFTFEPKREYAAAADDDASAADIIGAGGPVGVATSADQRLVAWNVSSDDDEGPQQAAWRLYDDRGERVADGKLGQVFEAGAVPELTTVPDGFLLENYTGHRVRHLSTDGTITDVPASAERRPARAGDVLLESLEGTGSSVYRPGEHATYRLPRLPFRNPQGLVLDSRGTLWVLVDWAGEEASLASSPGGAGPWSRTTARIGRDGYPVGLALAGDRLVLPFAHDDDSSTELAGMRVRRTDAAPATPWRLEPTTGVRLGDMIGPTLGSLEDGRVLLSGDSGTTWLQATAGSWNCLRPPRGEDSGSVVATDQGLFVTNTRSHQLYESTDEGRSWHVAAR